MTTPFEQNEINELGSIEVVGSKWSEMCIEERLQIFRVIKKAIESSYESDENSVLSKLRAEAEDWKTKYEELQREYNRRMDDLEHCAIKMEALDELLGRIFNLANKEKKDEEN